MADHSARSPATGLTQLLDPWTRLQLYLSSLFAVFFLCVYGRLVCPFINGRIDGVELATNLLVVFALQVALRELLFRFWPTPRSDRSLPRHGYRLSMLVWFLSGLFAMGLHAWRYQDFPAGSHVKLLSGYWVLGMGILAQWEYVVLEHACRCRAPEGSGPARFLEKITRRVLEGNFVLTLGPTVAMLLVIWRYVRQGTIDVQVFSEVAYLGLFCVAMGLLVAMRYGQTLRDDTQDLVGGLQAIGAGSLTVRLDATRHDELGRVASGVNGMVTSLSKSHHELECRLREREALSEVALAISSLMDHERVLEMVITKSQEVVHADASSLLLFDPESETLRFHVTRGEAQASIAGATVSLGQGIAGVVARSRESLIVPDVTQDPRFESRFDEATGFRTRSLMTVPLLSKDGRLLGVVQALNKRDGQQFTEGDLRVLEAFAAQASTAMENARLYEETRRMAEDLRVALEAERNLTIEKEKMGAYVPKTVVDEISRDREKKLALGGKTLQATILFADIKGFTRLSEELDPQDIVRVLNIFMTGMSDVIEEEGGIIDKFIGDGIMAIFTPQENENPARQAIRAGVRMQRRVLELQAEWESTQPLIAELRIRVGINSGEVVAGNVGSETRMDYTVIGDNVNVASRIEGACEPGAVWISDSTLEAAGEGIAARTMPPISVKNRVQPVQCYEVSLSSENAA